MVSVIIPARNEIYLKQTIDNVLANAEGEIEIIVLLDGYIPDPQLVYNDNRVKFVYHATALGQRQSINRGAKIARGEFVMKLDAHCAVDKGFDVKLAADCEKDWTVIPRMYNLDVETWKPKLIEDWPKAVRHGKVHDYIMMGQEGDDKLRTLYYPHYENKQLHRGRENILIDDTMSCMGPCFFMRKDRFWELGGCDEEHGSWGQQGIEVACKAWLSGGSLKVNKKTWFAHWFRGGGGPGWPYDIDNKQVYHAKRYSEDLWLNDKWPLAKRKFSWLIDKFNPPGWMGKKEINTEEVIQREFSWRKQNLPWYPLKGKREDLALLFGKLGFREGVEVGTRNGNFAEVLFQANPNLHLTCVDPWAGHIAKHYEETVKKLSKYRVTCVRKTSMDAVDSFKDRSLDFVYIDGNHTFDFVMMDVIKWSPKVRSGGIIAGHDYDFTDVREAFETYAKCHDIRPVYRTREEMPTIFWVKK